MILLAMFFAPIMTKKLDNKKKIFNIIFEILAFIFIIISLNFVAY